MYGYAHGLGEFTYEDIVCDEAEVEQLVQASFAALAPVGLHKLVTPSGFRILFVHALDEGARG